MINQIIEKEKNMMADDPRMALIELLRKAELEQDMDFLHEGVRVFSEALMELEVSQYMIYTLDGTHTSPIPSA